MLVCAVICVGVYVRVCPRAKVTPKPKATVERLMEEKKARAKVMPSLRPPLSDYAKKQKDDEIWYSMTSHQR